MENKELQGGLLDLLRIDLRDHSVIAVVGGGGKTSLIHCLREELVTAGKKVMITTTTHMAYESDSPFVRVGKGEEALDPKDTGQMPGASGKPSFCDRSGL